jgi:Rab GDP dissociation inhibitor
MFRLLFVSRYDVNVPNDNGIDSKCFISKGYDPTSHFESAITDVIEMYARITGKPLELKDKKEEGDGAQ